MILASSPRWTNGCLDRKEEEEEEEEKEKEKEEEEEEEEASFVILVGAHR
jgi:hypothetical protein